MKGEQRMKQVHVGQSATRVDALDKVTGKACYVADISLPQMLHAKVKRAGIPHGRIRSIETSKAEAMPGVKKIVTGQDCEMLFGTCLWDQPPLAVDKVRHAGEAVAVVLAETENQAAAAAEMVNVEYEELPFVIDPIKAADPDAPLIHEKNGTYHRMEYSVHPIPGTNIFHHYKLRKGDLEAGRFESEVTVEEEFEFPISSHAALEPHGAVCRFSHDREIEIWASNQAPFVLRDVLSDMFNIPASKVRVHIPYLGGGFGGKSDVSIEPMVAYAASFVPGYAVKLVLTRKEVFTSSLVGRGMKGRMQLGAKRDGTLTFIKAEMYFADGAYGDTSWPVDTVAGHNCTGPYEFPNVAVDVYGVYTNTPPVGAYRGYGHPEGQFMSSRLIDMLARKLDMPVEDIMKKNFLSEGRKNALGQVIKKSHGDLAGCLDEVKKAIEETPFPERDERYLYGRGLAAMMKSPKMATNAASSCSIQINVDGCAYVNLAGIEMGQGVLTVFAQMAADVLQIPLEKVKIYTEVDTQFSPWEWQTVASMQTYRGGRAIQDAGGKIIELAKENAARVWNCEPVLVEYSEGKCIHPNTGDRISLGALARGYMYSNGLTVGSPLITTGWYRVPELIEPDPETGMGNAAGSWTFGCQACTLNVDRKTGEIKILHFASAFDVGKAVNPTMARGQVVGGVVQGLGATLMEKILFNEAGSIKNFNFPAYQIPRHEHAPLKQTVVFLETPNEEGPWSAKPVAEHPIVAVAPVVLNALYDATGIEFTSLPVTKDRMQEALRKREAL
jgi:carbon-monoxide dehydrogenase large subunit